MLESTLYTVGCYLVNIVALVAYTECSPLIIRSVNNGLTNLNVLHQ